jgi:chorismate dehydratase
MLFSKEGWRDLDGKRIAITDESATSIVLLKILLQQKYGVKAHFERLHGGVNDLTGFDAVLLIGDQALRANKHGLPGFELVFDLANEWYDWQKLPFVFAVWAARKEIGEERCALLKKYIAEALDAAETDYAAAAGKYGRAIGLTDRETQEYLAGLNYRLGEREKQAIARFRTMLVELEEPANEKEVRNS